MLHWHWASRSKPAKSSPENVLRLGWFSFHLCSVTTTILGNRPDMPIAAFLTAGAGKHEAPCVLSSQMDFWQHGGRYVVRASSPSLHPWLSCSGTASFILPHQSVVCLHALALKVACRGGRDMSGSFSRLPKNSGACSRGRRG